MGISLIYSRFHGYSFEIWRYFPLSFLFILARMQSIPKDVYEAAEMDGASPLQQFWFLSLPNIVGILAILFLLRFIWTFNKFDDIFLLTGGNAGTRTLTLNVYEQPFAISILGAGAAVATGVFVILLSFLEFLFIFRLRITGDEILDDGAFWGNGCGWCLDRPLACNYFNIGCINVGHPGVSANCFHINCRNACRCFCGFKIPPQGIHLSPFWVNDYCLSCFNFYFRTAI